ncbi:MAG: ArsR family transcriptional regulator [Elusimicrobia bacterium]|nr:MAG: ArsR family transcriptional regulator [Elusimicrobiota bacterium]KAF0153863.1 MAG: ArsR family transcriptional regulator [Elusimicrobiota bacterium]
MKASILGVYGREAAAFKALGHPTRLFIAHQLGRRDACVCELRDLVGDDISTVSKHLSVLRNAGIVDSVRKGNQIIYNLKLRCVLNIRVCGNFGGGK